MCRLWAWALAPKAAIPPHPIGSQGPPQNPSHPWAPRCVFIRRVFLLIPGALTSQRRRPSLPLTSSDRKAASLRSMRGWLPCPDTRMPLAACWRLTTERASQHQPGASWRPPWDPWLFPGFCMGPPTLSHAVGSRCRLCEWPLPGAA